MPKLPEHPAHKEEDLEIKTKKELQEAKKAAGVRKHRKEVLDDAIELARKTEDKKLLSNLEKQLKTEEGKSSFTREFWERHQDYGEELKEKHGYAEEMLTRLFVLKDMRRIFMKLGFKVIDIHYQDKQNKKSDIIFNIDTFNEGRFEIHLITGEDKEPEIVIKPKSNYETKSLKEAFDLLKNQGIFISPIFLAGKGEEYPFPQLPDTPPKLPPSARKITDRKWEEIKEKGELIKGLWNWPMVGAKGLRTKHGMINGVMIHCDGYLAVFETPQGKIEIPFSELLDPFGYSYSEREEKKEGGRMRSKNPPKTKYLRI